jgi:hypothetical protein
MRTTLVLDDALMRSVYAKAGQEHRPIKKVMNELLERGLAGSFGILPETNAPWTCQVHKLGGNLDYSSAWDMVDALEAEAIVSKLELHK